MFHTCAYKQIRVFWQKIRNKGELLGILGANSRRLGKVFENR